MKSCRVFIKSNYIKKAKDDWVHFEANILTNDKLYNLKLTSINSENKSEGTLRRFNSTTNGFKVFLNLSEFKSIDIKPINFRNSERYAIKLVPSGFLNYKKLLIVPENEEDLEKLCGVLSQNVHKSHNEDSKITEFNNATIRSQSSHNNAENKKKKVEEIKISPPSPPEELSEEVYFSMDDNDVYDGNSLENSYTICVEESIDSKRLGLKGSFILRLKEEGLELVDIKTGEVVHKFPYIFIRRFGAKNDILRLEAGRKCTSGEGYLMFRFKNAQVAVETIREFVKELKKTASASQDDCSTLNNSHRNSVVLSINSSNLDCVNDTLIKRNNWSNSTSTINSPKSVQSNFVANAQNNNLNNSFFVEENVASPKPSPPVIAPKPINTEVSPMTLNRPNKTVNYPVYSAINHNRNNISSSVRSNVTNGPRLAILNRPPIINNNFNRNHQIASSFACRRPTQVNIPVIKDDSYCPKVNTSEVYDNMPMYERKNDRNKYLSNNNNSSVRYASSYSMQGPIGISHDGNYDNVPNSQRCIKDLENMLNDLGIPQH